MKLTKKMRRVVADIEYIIGSECYNPNSHDGWNDIDGCDYRYPINVRNRDGEFVKIRNNINETYLLDEKDITADSIKYMKYKFGSNELFIGLGIINALEYLEERYGLDFVEMEKKRRNS